MHLPRPIRAVGLLAAAAVATCALWLAASPPATSTLAPAALGQP
jgi:hypothetical protein